MNDDPTRAQKWVTDHAYSADDFVLGNGKDYDTIWPDLHALLDAAVPDWRAWTTDARRRARAALDQSKL